MKNRPGIRLRSRYLLPLTLLAIAGCARGGGESEFRAPIRGDVYGKVLLKGVPVPAGSVITFVPDETSIYHAVAGKTDEKGEYLVTDVPIGRVKVMVTPPAESGTMNLSPNPTLGGGFPVKYTSAATSGETVEIKDGQKVEYNLDMREP